MRLFAAYRIYDAQIQMIKDCNKVHWSIRALFEELLRVWNRIYILEVCSVIKFE